MQWGSRGLRACVCLCALLAPGVAVFAAEKEGAEELAKLLSRPPSPGALALLATHLTEPAVAERLKRGLASGDWKTRAVAARLMNLGALRDLIPDVQRALEKEAEALAAEEELRALLTIGGPSFDEEALAAERRFSPRLDVPFASILARARGPHAIPIYFGVLRTWQLSQWTTRNFFRLATRGQHDSLMAASALALSHHDALAWQAVLDVAGDLSVRIDEPVLAAALGSREPQLRGETAWYAARSYREPGHPTRVQSSPHSTRGSRAPNQCPRSCARAATPHDGLLHFGDSGFPLSSPRGTRSRTARAGPPCGAEDGRP